MKALKMIGKVIAFKRNDSDLKIGKKINDWNLKGLLKF